MAEGPIYLSASLSMLPVSEGGMDKEHVEAMFILAGIPITAMESTPNQYYTGYADPWWIVSTQWGKIVIGWRKRVLSISWADTKKSAATECGQCYCALLVHLQTRMPSGQVSSAARSSGST